MKYCKECVYPFSAVNLDIPEDGICSSCKTFKKFNALDDSFWKKMDELLDQKLAIQEDKIKTAILTEVTEKLADITKRQTKLDEENKKIVTENKSLLQRISTIETRQKNVEQESQKMKNVINKQQ